jgi:2-phosphosulfolactate phosphatase
MIKMNIKIFQSIEGAKKATGLTVIIDVFRAFSLEAYGFSMGAQKIIPVGDSAVAYRLKEENPQMILWFLTKYATACPYNSFVEIGTYGGL